MSIKLKTPVDLHIRGYYSSGLAGKLITILPHRDYSHTSIVITFSDGSQTEYESTLKRGVHSQIPETRKPFHAYHPKLTKHQLGQAYYLCRTITGRYDRQGILGFIIGCIKQDSESYFCSEHTATIMLKIGKRLSKREPWEETPSFVCESNDSGQRDVTVETYRM